MYGSAFWGWGCDCLYRRRLLPWGSGFPGGETWPSVFCHHQNWCQSIGVDLVIVGPRLDARNKQSSDCPQVFRVTGRELNVSDRRLGLMSGTVSFSMRGPTPSLTLASGRSRRLDESETEMMATHEMIQPWLSFRSQISLVA